MWKCWMGRGNREGKLDSFGDTFGAGLRNVYAATTVVVGGRSEISTVVSVGGPGETIAGCFV